jgi:hypothetical protein
MPVPPKRKDYARNLRAKKPTGCTWCGGEIEPYRLPVTHASYCSDACVQADHEGIDDLPPVIVLAWKDPVYASWVWAGRPPGGPRYPKTSLPEREKGS